MNIIKKVSTIFFLSFTLLMLAQGPPSRKAPTKAEMEERLENLCTQLQLSGEKKIEFMTIERDFHALEHDLRQAGKTKEELKPLRKEKTQKIKALLSESEFESYKSLMEQKREHRSH